jgi:hypothetical protein
MGLPVATKKSGYICFAFPDVCMTPIGTGSVPIPYPNIGQLSDAEKVSDSSTGTGEVKVKGNYVILANKSEIASTTGDEAGTDGGITSGTTGDKVEFIRGSSTVKIHGQMVVRMTDMTKQNKGNAVGMVLGGETSVLVGG